MKRSIAGFAVGILGSLALSPAAWSGEVVRLKAGNVRLENLSRTLHPSQRLPFAQEPRYFVVQFSQAVTPQELSRIQATGVTIQSYLPDDAFLVSGSRARVEGLLALLPNLREVALFQSEWRISPDLLHAPFSILSQKAISLYLSLGKGEVQEQVALWARAVDGVEKVLAQGQDLVVRAHPAAIEGLSRIEGVTWIQRLPQVVSWDLPVDEPAQQDNPSMAEPPALSGFESGTRSMNFEQAWQKGFTGKGQTVSISDTGADTGKLDEIHKDLSNTIAGFAVGFGATSWADSNGHGTHVMGSVGGNGALSQGKVRGGAYEAKLIINGLWSPIMDNLAFPQDFNKILSGSVKEGALINTNSWGNPNALGVYDSLANKVDAYLFEHPEMLILFAAGNSGQDANGDGHIDGGSVSSPSTAKNVLTIGASENLISQGGIQKKLGEMRDGTKKWGVEPLKSDTLSNHVDGVAAFSSRGPTEDGRTKPELVAPGTNILSTRSHHPKASPMWGEYSADYVWAGGTSMATPLAAGAAAVTRQYLMERFALTQPTGALVKAAMIHSAKDMFPGQYGSTGATQELKSPRPNSDEGYGRVDMGALTSWGSSTWVADETQGLQVSEEKSWNVEVAQGATLRATLTYVDAPAAANARKALVNDLDLQIVGPSGEVKSLDDRANNTEMLELKGLAAGTYRVVVKAINIPQGKQGRQPYAVVVSQE